MAAASPTDPPPQRLLLRDLEPEFVRLGPGGRRLLTDLVDAAQGVAFLCPACRAQHRYHTLLVWLGGRGVPPDYPPAQRHRARGTGYADLTLEPSVVAGGSCGWRGYVTAGEVVTCR